MNSLLVIHSSGRVSRSVTRALAHHAIASWREANPGAPVIERDVGLQSPPTVSEPWIAAAYAPATQRTATERQSLSLSESIIDEVESAAAIVIAAPMYNFGMPAQLKAYIDQLVRSGRTFALTADPANKYRPLLEDTPVLVVESSSTAGFYPGGAIAHLNFLEPHLRTVLGFVGLQSVTFCRVSDDQREEIGAPWSLDSARREVESWIAQSTPPWEQLTPALSE